MLSEKPWRLEVVMRYMVMVMLSIVAGGLLILWLTSAHAPIALPPPHVQLVIGTLSLHGTILILLPRFLREHEIDIVAAFGFAAPRFGRAFGNGIGVCLATIPLMLALGQISANLIQWFGLKPEPQVPIQMLREGAPHFRLLLFFTAVILAPLAEEIAFRGILYPTLKQLGFQRLALVGSALLFGFIHQNAVAFLPLTFMAVVLTLLYEHTNNLISPIVMHSFFNLVNFILAPLIGEPKVGP